MRVLLVFLILTTISRAAQPLPLSPSAMVASADGAALYVACATANRVLRFDTASQKATRAIDVPAAPRGLALLPDGEQLFVTCAAPEARCASLTAQPCSRATAESNAGLVTISA